MKPLICFGMLVLFFNLFTYECKAQCLNGDCAVAKIRVLRPFQEVSVVQPIVTSQVVQHEVQPMYHTVSEPVYVQQVRVRYTVRRSGRLFRGRLFRGRLFRGLCN